MTETFHPSDAPGLDTSADFLRSEAFIEVDYREPRYARKGGWYRVDFSHYDDRTAGQFTFNRVDADLRQFVGFLAGRRVIAARLFVSTSDTNAGQTMPFYFMPTLGGNDTLRGFREYRFRGPHAILAQGDTAGRSGAASTARSSTTPARSPTAVKISNFEDLETDYGIRVPLQHQQRHHPPRRCRVREPRWQAPVYRLWRRLLEAVVGHAAARLRAPRCVGLAALQVPSRCRARPHRASIPTIRCGRTTTAPWMRRRPAPIEDSNGYDFVVNTFGHPGERRDVRALNVNTVDEVPDSSWFTNRIGQQCAERRRNREAAGSRRAADPRWLEGLRRKEQRRAARIPHDRPRGQIYQIEVDPPSNPELASGAEIIGTAFYHAIGYNVVDVYLAELDRELARDRGQAPRFAIRSTDAGAG